MARLSKKTAKWLGIDILTAVSLPKNLYQQRKGSEPLAFPVGVALYLAGTAAAPHIARHLVRQYGYDPVYDTVSARKEEIYQGGKMAVETAVKYPGQIAGAGLAVAARLSPAIGAGMVVYDIYRLTQYVEREYPGKMHEQFRYQLSVSTDADRYWRQRDYDFDSYAEKGDSWKRYHSQKVKRRRPKKPIYVREFV